MSTDDNLKAAFAGESQANRRYLAFAAKAQSEGLRQIARLFRAVAEAETVHAHAHLRVMKGIGSTAQNLEAAIAGEAHEFQRMYPDFAKAAEAERQQAALTSFRYAMAVEQTHHRLFNEALAVVKAGRDLPEVPVRVCQVCGHTVVGDAPDRCPVCNAGRERFMEIG